MSSSRAPRFTGWRRRAAFVSVAAAVVRWRLLGTLTLVFFNQPFLTDEKNANALVPGGFTRFADWARREMKPST